MVRLFQTKRGLLALLAFATIWFIILYYFVNSAAAYVMSDGFEQMATQLFSGLGLSALLEWPVSEYVIYWLIAVYFFPIFSVLVCSDQICSDTQRGTLRFLTLRSTRVEIILGRYLGQLLIISILILLTILATAVLACVRDVSLLSDSLALAAKLLLELVVVVMPFIALMSLLNTLVSSAKLAIVMTILFFGLGPILIGIVNYFLGHNLYLHFVFPGGQISSILSQSHIGFSQYLLPLIQTLVFLICANVVMKRASI